MRFDYPDVFMYVDPPYLLSTRTSKQYKHEMTNTDHIALLQLLKSSKAKVMLSGYESDVYNSFLPGWQKRHFSSNAEYGGNRIETIWMNYDAPDEFRQQMLF